MLYRESKQETSYSCSYLNFRRWHTRLCSAFSLSHVSFICSKLFFFILAVVTNLRQFNYCSYAAVVSDFYFQTFLFKRCSLLISVFDVLRFIFALSPSFDD